MNALAARLGIELHRIEFLRRPQGQLTRCSLPAGVRLVERGADEVVRICANARAHGQVRSEQRMATRFGRGLRHVVLEQAGDAIAWCWLAAGVPRYIDELCWSVEMAAEQAWVRDAFVAPGHRGRRLLAAMLDAAARQLGGSIEYFSDVEAGNQPSLRAHAAAGFVPCASVRALEARCLRLRPKPPAALPTVHELRPSRRVLWLSAQERQWHGERVA